MTTSLLKMSDEFLRDPVRFHACESELKDYLIDYWYDETPDNHNHIVGVLDKMNSYANTRGDETRASVAFASAVLELEEKGYKNMCEFQYKDFRRYLDLTWNPYDF